jgi:MarR family transcriptional regulator, organic hydroperoxide resistance regulator
MRNLSGEGVPAPLRTLMRELSGLRADLCRALDCRLRAECGLSLASFQVMQAIGEHGPVPLAALVEAVALSAGNVIRLVSAIEAAGHCTVRPAPGPSRGAVVELTPAGAAVAHCAAAAIDEELELRLGSAVPAHELRRFGTVLSWLGQSTARNGSSAELAR